MTVSSLPTLRSLRHLRNFRNFRHHLCSAPLAAALSAGAAEPPLRVPVWDGPPPQVDGRLDEGLWARVAPLTDFIQARPQTGAAPTRRTELRLVQHGGVLYGAVRAWQPPEALTARTFRRDAESIDADDHIALVLDPRGTGRHGFIFRISALGAQRDGLIFDGSVTRPEWDARWDAAAQADGEGWTAEFAIPLSRLAGPGDTLGWRFNAERLMAATGERVRLFGPAVEREVDDLAVTQPLLGLAAPEAGWGLRLQPSVRWVHERREVAGQPTESRHRLEPSLDALYQLTPGLGAALTLNTDFADTELDDRQVSLSRFELFRPEKRLFFTQDSGRFAFGGLDGDDPDLLPFFSRRVGLGRVLDGGLKVSGSIGGLELGAFGAQVGKGSGLPSARVGVLRLAQALGDEQRVGMIATSGHPEGLSGSSLTGVDYQFRSSEVLDGRTLEAYAWTQQSRNAAEGTGRAHGARLAFPNVGLRGALSWQRIGEDFNPALGYLQESGITRADGEIGWWHRTEAGGHVLPLLFGHRRERLDRSEHSRSVGGNVEFANARGDYMIPEFVQETDQLAQGFEVLPGVHIPAGTHRFSYGAVYSGLSASRSLSGELNLRSGGFYNGRLHEQSVVASWRPSARWALKATLTRQDVRLATARFTARASSLTLEHTPSTRQSLGVALQHDNVSRQTGLALRGKWLLDQGREIRVALDRLRPVLDGETPSLRLSTSFSWYWER